MPSLNHSIVQARLIGQLYARHDKKFTILSEISLQLPEVKPAVPDVAIYPKIKVDWESDVIRLTTPPLTAIEILSPKQNLEDILDKFAKIYFAAGVQSAWLIIPPIKYISLYQPNMSYQPTLQGMFQDKLTDIEVDINKIFA